VKRRLVNGCPIFWEKGNATVIQHPRGFMLYVGGWRIGTYKRFPNAWKRAQEELKA
jgi:hypothetical protein